MDNIKDKRIGFRISEETKKLLEREAQRNGLSLSALLTEIIENYLENKKENKMENKDLIIKGMKNIINAYDKTSDLEKKNLIKNIDKPLTNALGSWAFFFSYIPQELQGTDGMTVEEVALVRAGQLYFYHRSLNDDAQIANNESYFTSLSKSPQVKMQAERDPQILKRLWGLATESDIDVLISNLIYFMKVSKGNFKADYTRLVIDFVNAQKGDYTLGI